MRRFAALLAFLTGVILLIVGQTSMALSAPDGDGPQPESRPILAVTEAEKGLAVAALVRSDAFAALDPRVRGQLIANRSKSFRPLLIEGEQRGVTFVVPASTAVNSAGPWTKVDKDRLVEAASNGRSNAASAANHDEYDALLSELDVSADDYETTTYVADASVSAIEVAVDTTTGQVLRLAPFSEPKSDRTSNGQ